jgi:hypothetical protein
LWYCKARKKATTKTFRPKKGKRLEYLFREYLSYAMGVGVVRGESSVGVPLRRLFRYEWMDVMLASSHIYSVDLRVFLYNP